jgi:hypothetical protein
MLAQKTLPRQLSERVAARTVLKAQADSLARAQGLPVRVERPDGTIFEIQRFDGNVPAYYKTENLNSAKTISTNKLWSGAGFGYSLSGSGILLGEWDGGAARPSHQEFGGRVTNADGGAYSAHSTHVAGTLIAAGVNAGAHGMANQATLVEHNWTNDVSEMATEAAGGLQVSNHSYGLITGWDLDYFTDGRWVWFGDSAVSETEDYSFGFYGTEAADWDVVGYYYPNYLIVKSAGNDRNEGPGGAVLHWFFKNGIKTLSTKARSLDGNGGYDCVSGAGVAKNVLTVGAINDITGGYANPSGVVMSSFSSWGPTDDGRIKPDIVANGVGLTSSVETADNAYASFSGTSMASPSATGSIGLLLEHQKNLHGPAILKSATLKGLVIHTADEAGPANGPDYVFGWGLMNTLKAVQLMTLDTVDGAGSHVREMNLPQGTSIQFDISATGTSPLRATIAWLDVAGAPPPPSLDPTTLMLVNDLDLRIIRKRDQTVYQPWVLDPANPTLAATTGDNNRDNVEQVSVAAPERTVYTVRVTHKGATLYGGSKNFSIIMSGNTASIGPVVATLPDSASASLSPGGAHTDSVRIINTGDTAFSFHVQHDSTQPWLTFANGDSGSVAPIDTAYLTYTINASGLTQWSTFATTATLTGAASPIMIPFTLHTLGPKIAATPAYVSVDVDSGAVGHDTLVIRNAGTTPLSYVLRPTVGSFPVWMTVDDTDATVAPGDSAAAVLTFNAVSQPVDNYTTFVTLSSNDTATGPVVTQVDLHVGTRFPFDVGVRSRWNMVSLPVLPFTHYKNGLYPTSSSAAFGFSGSGYVQADTIENGAGYWLKFPSAQTVNLDGHTFDADTIPLAGGWNMVGALSVPIPAAAALTIPADILSSGFFEYTTGFALADSLRPGKGYFVLASQPGTLLLGTGASALPKQPGRSPLAGLNTITLEDGAKNAQTLYFGDAQARGPVAMMPPPPPSGSFDARFVSGALAEAINPDAEERAFSIRVQAAADPLTVRWTVQKTDKRRYTLVDEAGRSYDVAKTGGVTLAGSGSRTLTLSYSDPVLPTEFALGQNYPNPFNPSTKISYEVPSAGMVTIRVYNILGNEVATLVNGVREAGHHEVAFDASALPSGVYIYKMQSERFSSIKKMMLMR